MIDTYNDNNFNPNNPDNMVTNSDTKLDYKLITNITFGGIDSSDYPDFSDAYIESADYNGRELTEEELESVNEDIGYWYDELIQELI